MFTPSLQDFQEAQGATNDVPAQAASSFSPGLQDFQEAAAQHALSTPSASPGFLESIGSDIKGSPWANALINGQGSPQVASSIDAASLGGLQGLAGLPSGIALHTDDLINYLAGTHLTAPQVDFSQDPNVQAHPYFNLAGQLAGGTLGAGALGSAAELPTALAAMTPTERVIASGALGGAQGIAGSPDGGVASGLAGATLGSAGASVPEALQSAVGTNIPAVKAAFDRLGISDLIPAFYPTGNNYGQKFYENGLANVAGSGVLPNIEKVGSQLNNVAQNTMDSFGVNSSSLGDLKNDIRDKIGQQYSENIATKNAKYQDLADQADASGATVPLTNYYNKLKDIVSSGNDPKAAATFNQPNSDVVNLAQQALDGFKGMGFKDGEVPTLSFNDATSIDPNLTQNIKDSLNDPKTKSFYLDMKNALSQDIDNGVSQSNSPGLKSQWDDAKQYYQNNIVPFHDQSNPLSNYVPKTFDQTPSADNILNDLVKSGKSGNATQLAQNLNLVPAIKDSLGYGYAMQAGNLGKNSAKEVMSNVLPSVGALNNDVSNALYSPEQIQNFNDLNLAKNRLSSTFQTLSNPPTGMRDNFTNVLKTTAAPAAAAYWAAPTHLTGALAAGAAIPATMLAGRGVANLVNSNLLRNIAGGQSALTQPLSPYAALAGGQLANQLLGQQQ